MYVKATKETPGFIKKAKIIEGKRIIKEKLDAIDQLPPGFLPHPDVMEAIERPKPTQHNTIVMIGNAVPLPDIPAKKKRGRPLKFKDAETLHSMVQAYFTRCENEDLPLLVSGLALFLDTTRQTLFDYASGNHGSKLAFVVEQALLRCENYAETQLFKGKNVVGVMYSLTNQFDWHSAKKGDISATVNVNAAKEIERIVGSKKTSST